jgi:hypothetical protein
MAERALRQRHQRQGPALTLVVGSHHEDDVLDRHHDDQRPEDEADHAEHGHIAGAMADVAQRFAHRVERAGADVAEDDAHGADRQRPEPLLSRTGRFIGRLERRTGCATGGISHPISPETATAFPWAARCRLAAGAIHPFQTPFNGAHP